MITVDLGAPRKARLWLDELPEDLAFKPSFTNERELATERAPRGQARKLALELYLPRGPIVTYGILGAEFRPATGRQLKVQVASCADGQRIIDWSLAARIDDVRAGIPDWLSDAILNGITESRNIQDLGPGLLRFAWGAYGMVGSSEWMFKKISLSIVNILCHIEGAEFPSAERVRALIQEATPISTSA